MIRLAPFFAVLLFTGCQNARFTDQNKMLSYNTNMYEKGSLGIGVQEIERRGNISIVKLTPDAPDVPSSLVLNTLGFSLKKLGEIRGFEYGMPLKPKPGYNKNLNGIAYFGYTNSPNQSPRDAFGDGFEYDNQTFTKLSDIKFPPPWNK